MTKPVIFLSIPGLRRSDLAQMPALNQVLGDQPSRRLSHHFPAVTWPAQASLLTGCPPAEHGIVANGLYDRQQHTIEMWTFGNETIQRPQIWDALSAAGRTTAAWFPMLSKRCGADYVCMPAPVHNPDGSESLWCYTKPEMYYGQLLEQLGHFPLQHFWGPLANIRSSQWILDSAALAARQWRPDFFYIYVPHLDYAAQKMGPDSPEALKAVTELDGALGPFIQQMSAAYQNQLLWIVASEYVIVPTNHVTYPNRVLRENGWLQVTESEAGELLDLAGSKAFALVDHQFSHVYLREPNERNIAQVRSLLESMSGIQRVLDRQAQAEIGVNHPRSGDLIAVSDPHSWQAYYYWLDDRQAPTFARTVDIHRKPGYDPIELHLDFATKSIPLDATLNRGSHGNLDPDVDDESLISLPASWAGDRSSLQDTEIFRMVLNHFQVA